MLHQTQALPVTNLTISIATNFVARAMTNLTPQAPLTVLTGGDAVPPDPTAPSLVRVTFAHAAWACPPEGYSFYQAEIGLGAAVTVNGGREITFECCTVRNVGAWGVAFGPGSKDCALKGCTLTDLGAGGVKINKNDGVSRAGMILGIIEVIILVAIILGVLIF